MIKRQTAIKIRKTHRYLGLFLGIQFLMWTISGMYFSWTDIDEIHGDQFVKQPLPKPGFNDLLAPPGQDGLDIHSISLRDIGGKPYYWVNGSTLINARTGEKKDRLNREEALAVAEQYMISGLEVKDVEMITEASSHHEYRGKPLPAWVVHYDHPEALKAYVSANDGSFQRVRHRSWRWFDFLWMTHTMDYQGRDNFNTYLLRGFSLLGLITVLSGFLLWYTSSPTVRKIKK